MQQAKVARVQTKMLFHCADRTLPPWFLAASVPGVLLHFSLLISLPPCLRTYFLHIIAWGSCFTVLMDPLLLTSVKHMRFVCDILAATALSRHTSPGCSLCKTPPVKQRYQGQTHHSHRKVFSPGRCEDCMVWLWMQKKMTDRTRKSLFFEHIVGIDGESEEEKQTF